MELRGINLAHANLERAILRGTVLSRANLPFAEALDAEGKEVWVARSITLEALLGLWETSVGLIWVRGAGCTRGAGIWRFCEVKEEIVRHLVATIQSAAPRPGER